MNTLVNTRTLTASAFVAAAAFSILSFGSAAQASGSLAGCTGPNAKKVVDCCLRVTAVHRPLWMMTTRVSCSAAVACKARGGGGGIHLVSRAAVVATPRICSIKIVLQDNPSHSIPSGGRGRLQ